MQKSYFDVNTYIDDVFQILKIYRKKSVPETLFQ